MPFTFSHPAIVLPATILPKRFYSLTGLIIGSMTPDFEYFIRMKGLSIYSHNLPGILWFDLPLGILLAFIYHGIVRDAFIANLPNVLKVRLSKFCRFNWMEYAKKNWLVVIISLVVGAASHIFWDNFTHDNGFFVKYLPILQHHIWIHGFPVPIYFLCQHLSTVIGGILVLYYIFQLPKDEQYKSSFDVNYWVIICVISLIIIVFKILTGFNYRSFDQSIVTLIASGLISLTVTSWLFRNKVELLVK